MREFPPGVLTDRPFLSSHEGILWLREAADGDHGPHTELGSPLDIGLALPLFYPHGVKGPTPLTLAPIHGPLVALEPADSIDMRYARFAVEPEAHPGPLTLPNAPTPAIAAQEAAGAHVGLYRLLAGQEATARRAFDGAAKSDRPTAAKTLGGYENALIQADLLLVTALNDATCATWRHALNSGLDVYPDPANPTNPPPRYSGRFTLITV